MESQITIFLCIVCWLHGATVGVAIGSSHLYNFVSWTFFSIIFITCMWIYSPTSRRIAASLTFLVCCAFLIAVVKSIACFRAPTLDKWNTLPDIGHDLLSATYLASSTFFLVNLDGYLMPDLFLLVLILVTSTFVWFHSQRLIIIRRFLMIYATVTLARAIIAVVTYLPDSNPKCQENRLKGKSNIDIRDIVHLSIGLLVPAFINDKNGCQDVIFNGRTILFILCAMTWHTYYKWVPSAINGVKLLIWAWVFLGISISIAQRMHYTLDVVLAGYFAITTWATYHRLANDVVTGCSFTSVWFIDKVIIYPVMEWMEAFTVESNDNSNNDSNIPPKLYRRDKKENLLTSRKESQRKAKVFRTSEL